MKMILQTMKSLPAIRGKVIRHFSTLSEAFL